jgi:hypothetical protein
MAPKDPPGADAHEKRHAAAARRYGMSYRWVKVRGEWRFEGNFSNTKAGREKAAKVLLGGGGGGDSKKDKRDAEALRNETGGCFGCLILATALTSIPLAATTALTMIWRQKR